MKYYQRIKDTREAQGMTQRELAARTGVAPGSLSAYENGNQSPPVEVAARLAKALKVSLDWLFGMDEAILQRPKTYADIIRMLLMIAESGLSVFPGIISKPWRSDQRVSSETEIQIYDELEQLALSRGEPADCVHTDYASIEISSQIVIDFFSAWLKLYTLHAQGILDDEVYSLWIEKRLKDLALEPLQYNWPEDGAGTLDK